MKSVIEFIKNLFSKNVVSNEEKSVFVKNDIFGDPVHSSDYFVPVMYDECKRRGYFTIDACHEKYTGDNAIFFNKIVKEDTLKKLSAAFGTSYSKRSKDFIHIYCQPNPASASL